MSEENLLASDIQEVRVADQMVLSNFILSILTLYIEHFNLERAELIHQQVMLVSVETVSNTT